jgi:hypothetical protein
MHYSTPHVADIILYGSIDRQCNAISMRISRNESCGTKASSQFVASKKWSTWSTKIASKRLILVPRAYIVELRMPHSYRSHSNVDKGRPAFNKYTISPERGDSKINGVRDAV